MLSNRESMAHVSATKFGSFHCPKAGRLVEKGVPHALATDHRINTLLGDLLIHQLRRAAEKAGEQPQARPDHQGGRRGLGQCAQGDDRERALFSCRRIDVETAEEAGGADCRHAYGQQSGSALRAWRKRRVSGGVACPGGELASIHLRVCP